MPSLVAGRCAGGLRPELRSATRAAGVRCRRISWAVTLPGTQLGQHMQRPDRRHDLLPLLLLKVGAARLSRLPHVGEAAQPPDRRGCSPRLPRRRGCSLVGLGWAAAWGSEPAASAAALANAGLEGGAKLPRGGGLHSAVPGTPLQTLLPVLP